MTSVRSFRGRWGTGRAAVTLDGEANNNTIVCIGKAASRIFLILCRCARRLLFVYSKGISPQDLSPQLNEIAGMPTFVSGGVQFYDRDACPSLSAPTES